MGHDPTASSTLWWAVGSRSQRYEAPLTKNSRFTEAFLWRTQYFHHTNRSHFELKTDNSYVEWPKWSPPTYSAYFLIGTHMEKIPQGYKGKDVSMNQRFKLLEKLKSSFWSSWHRDCLVTLRIREKWLTAGPQFAVGDLVLLAEDNIPPLKWKMARIQNIFSGNDDVNRVAELKTANGNLIRPNIKLRRLPITYGEPQRNRGQLTDWFYFDFHFKFHVRKNSQKITFSIFVPLPRLMLHA